MRQSEMKKRDIVEKKRRFVMNEVCGSKKTGKGEEKKEGVRKES